MIMVCKFVKSSWEEVFLDNIYSSCKRVEEEELEVEEEPNDEEDESDHLC